MKIAIAQVPMPVKDGSMEFSIRLKRPGTVRAIAFALVERPVVSFLNAKKGHKEYDEKPVMFVECCPDEELVERAYVILPSNVGFDAKPGVQLQWVATGVSPTSGTVVHLFEVLQEPS